jgi:hypothetical protein
MNATNNDEPQSPAEAKMLKCAYDVHIGLIRDNGLWMLLVGLKVFSRESLVNGIAGEKGEN